ncbi:MAG: hypothetical protein Q7R96_06585 [Nanoarchaeota archaeon]|nr:hypothetical protein [Nanoarchaeota archaeon]
MPESVVIPFRNSKDIRLQVLADQHQEQVFKQITEGLTVEMNSKPDTPVNLEVRVVKTGIPVGVGSFDNGYLILIRPQNGSDEITRVRSDGLKKFLLMESDKRGTSLQYNPHYSERPTVRKIPDESYHPCFLQVEFAYESCHRFDWQSGFPCSGTLERLKIEIPNKPR